LPVNFRTVGTAAPAETVFLDKDVVPAPSGEYFDIVLGPSLYWFREKTLPAKTVSAAKKLAPSVFDAIIPAGEYSYFVLKRDEGTFWLFAYNEAAIIDAIRTAGLRSRSIRNVYVAQTECLSLERPLLVGTQKVLAAIDGVITLLPSGYVSETEPMDAFFKSRPRTANRIPITLYRNALLDHKSVRSLTTVAAVFALIYGLNFLIARQQLHSVTAKQEKIMETYRLPQTSFERDGLLNSLENKQRQQAAMREKAKALFALAMKDGTHMETMALSAQKISLSYAVEDEKDVQALKKQLETIVKIGTEKLNGKTWTVEATYE